MGAKAAIMGVREVQVIANHGIPMKVPGGYNPAECRDLHYYQQNVEANLGYPISHVYKESATWNIGNYA